MDSHLECDNVIQNVAMVRIAFAFQESERVKKAGTAFEAAKGVRGQIFFVLYFGDLLLLWVHKPYTNVQNIRTENDD